MKEYLLLFRNEKKDEAPSAEQMKMAMQQWQSWITGIAKGGKYSGTNRLLPEGKTLKPNNVITDGPYLEAREMVGGYILIKANSFDEAVEIARSCPNLLFGGNVEVRAVMPIDSDPASPTFLQQQN